MRRRKVGIADWNSRTKRREVIKIIINSNEERRFNKCLRRKF
jgi:hypothetical protein